MIVDVFGRTLAQEEPVIRVEVKHGKFIANVVSGSFEKHYDLFGEYEDPYRSFVANTEEAAVDAATNWILENENTLIYPMPVKKEWLRK